MILEPEKFHGPKIIGGCSNSGFTAVYNCILIDNVLAEREKKAQISWKQIKTTCKNKFLQVVESQMGI